MKYRITLLTSLIALFTTSVMAGDFIRETPHAFRRVFVPQGYDNDDSVDIVATGTFATTCFGKGDYSSRVNYGERTIVLTATAYEYSGKCSNTKIDFSQLIHLGRISEPGVYSVFDGNSQKFLGRLPIAERGESEYGTDSAFYAPVDDAFLFLKKGRPTLRLVGVLPDESMLLKSIDLVAESDALVALPVVAYDDYDHGIVKPSPYFRDIPVKAIPPQLPFLLHVRTRAGESINKLITSISNIN